MVADTNTLLVPVPDHTVVDTSVKAFRDPTVVMQVTVPESEECDRVVITVVIPVVVVVDRTAVVVPIMVVDQQQRRRRTGITVPMDVEQLDTEETTETTEDTEEITETTVTTGLVEHKLDTEEETTGMVETPVMVPTVVDQERTEATIINTN